MNTKEELLLPIKRSVGRRSFMKGSLLAGGAVIGAGLLATSEVCVNLYPAGS
jgi:hypothetical protein